ncbi:hypothetical protein C8Q78DRAFT_292370 [Trametes maxima]|nr:hypothetical protein C8Q78DRAFT_292370 [Trametes maxima]
MGGHSEREAGRAGRRRRGEEAAGDGGLRVDADRGPNSLIPADLPCMPRAARQPAVPIRAESTDDDRGRSSAGMPPPDPANSGVGMHPADQLDFVGRASIWRQGAPGPIVLPGWELAVLGLASSAMRRRRTSLRRQRDRRLDRASAIDRPIRPGLSPAAALARLSTVQVPCRNTVRARVISPPYVEIRDTREHGGRERASTHE